MKHLLLTTIAAVVLVGNKEGNRAVAPRCDVPLLRDLPLCDVPRWRPDSEEPGPPQHHAAQEGYNNAVTRAEAERFWAIMP